MCLSNSEVKSSYFVVVIISFLNSFKVFQNYFVQVYNLAIVIKQLSYQVDINFHQIHFMHFFSLSLFHYFVLLLFYFFFLFPKDQDLELLTVNGKLEFSKLF
jgi:hypothetical protein